MTYLSRLFRRACFSTQNGVMCCDLIVNGLKKQLEASEVGIQFENPLLKLKLSVFRYRTPASLLELFLSLGLIPHKALGKVHHALMVTNPGLMLRDKQIRWGFSYLEFGKRLLLLAPPIPKTAAYLVFAVEQRKHRPRHLGVRSVWNQGR